MTDRRDWLLAQMGIDQYRLRRPDVLRGEVAIPVKPTTKLLIIGTQSDLVHQPFIADVLRSLLLESAQVLFLSAQQVNLLPQPLHCLLWFIGVSPDKSYATRQIESPALASLMQQAQAKRQLWQQFCNYDDDLFSTAQ